MRHVEQASIEWDDEELEKRHKVFNEYGLSAGDHKEKAFILIIHDLLDRVETLEDRLNDGEGENKEKGEGGTQ